jgi:hypothetical protein
MLARSHPNRRWIPAVSWMSGFGYFASWGIVMVVWVLLGLSTFADDE